MLRTILFMMCFATLAAGQQRANITIPLRTRAVSEEPRARDADGGISAPLLGWVTDASRFELRPIIGVPVSSELGPVVHLPEGSGRTFLSPGQKWALVESNREGASMSVLRLDDVETLEMTLVAGSITRADTLVFSPSGDLALAYEKQTRKAQIITKKAFVLREFSLEIPNNADAPFILAIDDEGLAPVAVTIGSGSVFLLEPGDIRTVHSGGTVGGLTYLPRSATLLVSDRDTRTLTSIQAAHLSSRSEYVYPIEMPDTFVQLEPFPDGKSLFLISEGRVARVDLNEVELRWVSLPAPATDLIRLRHGASFIIRASLDEPAWWLNASGAESEIFFTARVPTQEESIAEGKAPIRK